MSPTLCGCVVCGYLIHGHERVPWLSEYRAVYSSPEGTFVSGVGCYDDPDGTWIAPSDPSVRWDDPDYHFPARDIIPVMRQPPENDRHGFVLHDACWHLLQKGISICWGHTYGGLNAFGTKDHYPWEDRLTEEYDISETNAREDPFDIPEISDLLLRSSQRMVNLNPISITRGNDYFARLPWEVLETIAINLQTVDVLSLVRASRFEPGRDRAFLFEKRNSKESRDWIELYKMTSHAHSPPGLRNRRRIWQLIRAAPDLLCSHLDEALESSHMSLGPGLRWREVVGDIEQENVSPHPIIRKPFNDGCLNDESFTGEDPMTAGYQPLICAQFGGLNGRYLRYLTEICVTRLGGLCCIEFQYGAENIPTEMRKLGRRKVTDFSVTECFQVDGPGGELIESIDVGIKRMYGEKVYRFHRHGSVDSFKISTNRGRSAIFPSDRISPSNRSQAPSYAFAPLQIAPGTTITGLYASQHPEEGIFSLGAISEALEE